MLNNNEIVQLIKDKLSQIEEWENIRIIYACESGRRVWGFASPDCKAETFYSACKTAESRPKNEVCLDQTYSDYDVRFVFVRPVQDYLRVKELPDFIDAELNEVYDINGWDLKKFFKQLYKSNPVLFEWAVLAASWVFYKNSWAPTEYSKLAAAEITSEDEKDLEEMQVGSWSRRRKNLRGKFLGESRLKLCFKRGGNNG